MNEVDEDNNIVGDQPFYGVSFPSKESTTAEHVRFWLIFIIVIGVIAAAIYGLYRLYKHYNKKPETSTLGSLFSKKKTQTNTQKSSFAIFQDEET